MYSSGRNRGVHLKVSVAWEALPKRIGWFLMQASCLYESRAVVGRTPATKLAETKTSAIRLQGIGLAQTPTLSARLCSDVVASVVSWKTVPLSASSRASAQRIMLWSSQKQRAVMSWLLRFAMLCLQAVKAGPAAPRGTSPKPERISRPTHSSVRPAGTRRAASESSLHLCGKQPLDSFQ